MKIFVLSLALSFSALASKLVIKNTKFIKLEKNHQFKVEFHGDSGEVTDVTDKTDFFIDSHESIRNGEFRFSLPEYNKGEMISKNLLVHYQHGSKLYSTTRRLFIDPTPDYILINGPFSLTSNDVYQFKAYGYYNGRAIDLTENGRWISSRGITMDLGLYRSPLVMGEGRIMDDSLVFIFARSRFTKNLNVRAY